MGSTEQVNGFQTLFETSFSNTREKFEKFSQEKQFWKLIYFEDSSRTSPHLLEYKFLCYFL